jgi:hypothetical protein
MTDRTPFSGSFTYASLYGEHLRRPRSAGTDTISLKEMRMRACLVR